MPTATDQTLDRNEAKFATVFNVCPDFITITARDTGRYREINDAFERITGYGKDEVIGRTSLEIGIWETQAERRRMLEALKGSLRLENFEVRIRRKSGEVIDAALSVERATLGGEDCLIIVGRDISDRKRVEDALRDSEQRWRFALEGAGDGVWDWDLEAGRVRFSRRWKEMLGYDEGEIGGDFEEWKKRVHPDDLAPALASIQAYLDGRTPSFALKHRLMCKDGNWKWILSRGMIVGRTADGEPQRLIGTHSDITQSKEVEALLAEQAERLAHSNAELEQFAYVASHDLREPLRMISSYITLLERRYQDRFDDDAREFLRFAREGAQRMDRMVLDLLEFSRVGRLGDPFSPVPLADVVNSAANALRLTIEECGAELAITGNLPVVTGAHGELSRLFQNLIGNAVKYRHPDRRPQVRIAASPCEAGWRIEVADNGIGIAEEYFERIFAIFQRLHTRDKYDGTGIGLAVCKKIVEHHGGRLWVESLLGDGSTFFFTLRDGAAP